MGERWKGREAIVNCRTQSGVVNFAMESMFHILRQSRDKRTKSFSPPIPLQHPALKPHTIKPGATHVASQAGPAPLDNRSMSLYHCLPF